MTNKQLFNRHFHFTVLCLGTPLPSTPYIGGVQGAGVPAHARDARA